MPHEAKHHPRSTQQLTFRVTFTLPPGCTIAGAQEFVRQALTRNDLPAWQALQDGAVTVALHERRVRYG